MKWPFDKGEAQLYYGTVMQLLWPGSTMPMPDTYRDLQPTELQGWNDEQLKLVLEEGQRQLAEINDGFEVLRARGQWLFTTILALLVLVAGQVGVVFSHHWLFVVGWTFGLVFLVIALLGSAAVFLATAQLGSVDTVILSNQSPDEDLVAVLARSYTKAVVISANAHRGRFTVLRDSLWFLVLGALIELATWSLLVAVD